MKFVTLENEIFLIESFLSDQNCKELIDLAENIGFKKADVQLSSHKRQLLTDIRNNERVNHENSAMAKAWWEKLNSQELPKYQDKKPIGISPYFRFYKYTPGQKFNMHKDGQQKVDNSTSYYTFLVYLNDKFSGGSTKFRLSELEIFPKAGQALLFQHQLWHQGTRVDSGVKYVLRSDLLYQG